MSQVYRANHVGTYPAHIAPAKLVEEKGSINLSVEAQMKLFELVLAIPFVSSEDVEDEEACKGLVRKAS